MIFYLTHGFCGKGKAMQYHIHKSDKCFYPVGDKNHVEYKETIQRVDACNERIKAIASSITVTSVIVYDGLKRIEVKR